MVEFLLKHGIDPSWTNKSGESALLKASQAHNDAMCKLLVEKGAASHRPGDKSAKNVKTPKTLISIKIDPETDLSRSMMKASSTSSMRTGTRDESEKLGRRESEHVTGEKDKELPVIVVQRGARHCGCYC